MTAAAQQLAIFKEVALGDFLAERATGTERDAGLTDALSARS